MSFGECWIQELRLYLISVLLEWCLSLTPKGKEYIPLIQAWGWAARTLRELP